MLNLPLLEIYKPVAVATGSHPPAHAHPEAVCADPRFYGSRTPWSKRDQPTSWARNPRGMTRRATGVLAGMPLTGDYAPSPSDWSRKQAELIEESGGQDGLTLR